MRVGLSLLTLVPGEMGGSETYARALCQALASMRTLDITALLPPVAVGSAAGLPSEVVTEYPVARTLPQRLRAMTTAALKPGTMRRRLAGFDVVHYPLTVPVPPAKARTAITLHDVQHLDLPTLFSRAERAFRRLAYDRAARRADIVIVPSAFVRDRAIERLGLDARRVIVVHHGVDHETFTPGAGKRQDLLLYPARAWPHKNHRTLLEAFAILRRDRPELSLVLAGAGTERFSGVPGVDARGVVPFGELLSLYRRAACLVFPSRYEGFGAPPLEAMACGTPVAASTAGSLPEVCGNAAVLFDPDDSYAIAGGIEGALARAEELRALGLERAAAFTWAAAASGHEEAYRAAAS